MTPAERLACIQEVYRALHAWLARSTANLNLPQMPDDDPIYVFLTNSGLDRELYVDYVEHCKIQNSLDHDRLAVFNALIRTPGIIVAFGDPRLDDRRYYQYVTYNPAEENRPDFMGPWVFTVHSEDWRAEQAEAWLYALYHNELNSGTPRARLVMISSKAQPPFHRVNVPPHLAASLQLHSPFQTITLPRRTRLLDPPHPTWPTGLGWLPDTVVRVPYTVRGREEQVVIFGVTCQPWEYVGPNPRNSLRDLWAIENCADILIAFHNGQSASTKWNYRAARQRGVPSVLVTFKDPQNSKSRFVPLV